MPGAKQGLQDKDPTIAELLRPLGYATAQFGKNHLGDRNEFLPTMHGFDEFYGNLYHLNAEEEPEDADYPKNPQFKAIFGPRGLLDCKATNVDDPTVDPRFGKVGKQTIKDTGPITRKRMETVEDELVARSVDFMERSVKAGKPFFIWHNANLNALRIDDWKISFKLMQGNIAIGTLIQPNMPQVVNLRQDPFERYWSESSNMFRWAADKLWLFVPAQTVVGMFVQSFKEYPPSQKSGSFSVDQVLEALQTGSAGTSK